MVALDGHLIPEKGASVLMGGLRDDHVQTADVKTVLSGNGPLANGGLSGGGLLALRGHLLPQRVGEGSQVQEAEGRGHAQGDPRYGIVQGRRDQGPRGG